MRTVDKSKDQTDDNVACPHNKVWLNESEVQYVSYTEVEIQDANLVVDTVHIKRGTLDTISSEVECRICGHTWDSADWPGEIEWL